MVGEQARAVGDRRGSRRGAEEPRRLEVTGFPGRPDRGGGDGGATVGVELGRRVEVPVNRGVRLGARKRHTLGILRSEASELFRAANGLPQAVLVQPVGGDARGPLSEPGRDARGDVLGAAVRRHPVDGEAGIGPPAAGKPHLGLFRPAEPEDPVGERSRLLLRQPLPIGTGTARGVPHEAKQASSIDRPHGATFLMVIQRQRPGARDSRFRSRQPGNLSAEAGRGNTARDAATLGLRAAARSAARRRAGLRPGCPAGRFVPP